MADILALKKEYCPASELSAQEKAFCEGYVDQCVAQSAQKSQGESTYEVVSESGTKVGDMDYLGCLGFSAFAGVSYGKAKGAVDVAAKPEPKQPANDVQNGPSEPAKPPVAEKENVSEPATGGAKTPVMVVRNYAALRVENPDGSFVYFTSKIPEHAFSCKLKAYFDDDFNFDFIRSYLLDEIEVLVGRAYCPGEGRVKELNDETMVFGAIEFSEDTGCIHLLLEWYEFECTDGTKVINIAPKHN